MTTYNLTFKNDGDKHDFIMAHFPYSQKGIIVNNPYSSGLHLSVSMRKNGNDEKIKKLAECYDSTVERF